jgi:predicted dehydrogenase
MDVITDPEVDAVWICSPSQYHADQIKACAANGKDVFCEKPIATDLAETVEAINACNEAGVKLMIGLQRRFDSNFMRVRESVVKGEVGDPIIVSCHGLCRFELMFCHASRFFLTDTTCISPHLDQIVLSRSCSSSV